MAIFKGKKKEEQSNAQGSDQLVAKAATAKKPDPNKLNKVRLR